MRLAMQPSDDEDSSVGGVMGRCDKLVGVHRSRWEDGGVDEDRRLERLLVRRIVAMNEVVKEVEGVFGVDVDGCRLTNEESMS